MTLIKKYSLLIIPLIAALVLIILRNTGAGQFRYDAGRLSVASFDSSNLITLKKMKEIENTSVLILLDKGKNTGLSYSGKVISVVADSLFSTENIKKIRRINGAAILYSGDESVSSRAWMALTQAGIKGLLILTPERAEK